VVSGAINERVRTVGAWVFVVGVAVGLTWWSTANQPVLQPVAFPHDVHVSLNMPCAGCHTGVREREHAGIPKTSVCALCHVPGRSSPSTPPELAAYLKAGREIPWRQVYRTPGHVKFSHRRHVVLGKLECAVCHGEVGQAPGPVTHQWRSVTMASCVACHRERQVTTDCLACHR